MESSGGVLGGIHFVRGRGNVNVDFLKDQPVSRTLKMVNRRGMRK